MLEAKEKTAREPTGLPRRAFRRPRGTRAGVPQGNDLATVVVPMQGHLAFSLSSPCHCQAMVLSAIT